jgi:bacillopeptidase F
MRQLICIYSSLIAFLLASLIPSTPLAQVLAPEVQTLLTRAPLNAEIPVIVTRSNAVDVKTLRAPNQALLRAAIVANLRSQSERSLAPLIAFLEKNGARRVRELWLINAVAAILPASTVERLTTYPGISSVRLDEVIPLPEVMPAVAAPSEWNIAAVGAGELWNLGFSGQGVVVANMDSGVDLNHPDLAGRWRGGTNSWFDAFDSTTTAPRDGDGHGTATMSLMVGGDAGGSAIGVAPGAQWIAARVFDDDGNATNSTLHQGFQWLLDPDGDPATDDAPDVVNNSWGFRSLVDRCYLEFQTDIQTLRAAGIAVVFSAGNEGPNLSTSISPANNPESFAVGAVDAGLAIANFSSRGPSACILDNDVFPEVVAPGVNIKVADRTFGLPITPFTYLDGTSFAAPHVAGAMALLRQAFPGLDPIELESALIDSAVDLGAVGPDDGHGFGMLDVLAAYRTLVPCIDADADGFFAQAVCGTGQDCDDGDPDIFPGAPEIKHDGIDQDCNGYDLTIEIVSAVYRPDIDELEVIATSGRMGAAHLQLDGFGAMTWIGPLHQWQSVVSPAGGDPGTIVVSGEEGSVTGTDFSVRRYAQRSRTAMTPTRQSIPVRRRPSMTASIRTAMAMT